jgi:uncharacterized protein (AIM24 family)
MGYDIEHRPSYALLTVELGPGEGLVCRFTGPGRAWLQSRSQDAFLSRLIPQLPTGGDNEDGFSVTVG